MHIWYPDTPHDCDISFFLSFQTNQFFIENITIEFDRIRYGLQHEGISKKKYQENATVSR